MRVGILTFHRAHNYGAVLQAYALQNVLTNLGHSVEFIDYQNCNLLSVYKVFDINRFLSKNPILCLKYTDKELFLLTYRYNRYKEFNSFIENNLVIAKENKLNAINENFDVVIVGSDQVWNLYLTRGFDPYYWGTFKTINSQFKLISYGASMEISASTDEENIKVSQYLENFDSISVREDSLKNALTDLTKRNIVTVVDPTLLLNRKQWNGIANKNIISRPYLLLYQVRNNRENEILAQKVSESMNLEIIYLSAQVSAKNSNKYRTASPAEFVSLFKHANFVVCSSFHGTVFSILFKIPFFSIIMKDGRDSRTLSLLNSLGLIERGKSYSDSICSLPIDWKSVENKLQELKRYSLDYLKRSIS